MRHGAFQLMPEVPHDAVAGSPLYRCHRNRQQSDYSVSNATVGNQSEGLYDLDPWLEVTDAGDGQHEPAGDPGRLPLGVVTAAKMHLPTSSPAIDDVRGISQFGHGRGGDSGQH
jgi:hypothetical protein